MLPLQFKHIPFIETAIAVLIICLPFSNSTLLINGIQTAKSFNFFYSTLILITIAALGILFKKERLKVKVTAIDILLLVFVAWLTLNKYLFQEFHSLSLRYFELLGLGTLYIIVRSLNTKYALYLLVSICIGGALQAVYGNLQLWGYYPSHHGMFKMTGSFFNPGPYAGYLCAVLPVAVGLFLGYREKEVGGFDATRLKSLKFATLTFWSAKRQTFAKQIRSIAKFRESESNAQRSEAPNLIEQLSSLAIKYLSLITIITILLVLPAARSRAAWLGAIAGIAYLAWHKYNLRELFKQRSVKRRSHQTRSIKLFKHSIRVRNSVLATMLIIVLAATTLGLYHYKKDSADGRLLIWTVTSNIIKDNPLLGVGQDRFKAHYMDYQADYFRNNPGSKYEQVADDNQYAFNEALLAWSENGLIGLILLLAILCFVFLSNSKEIESLKSGQLTSVSFQRGTRRNPFNNDGIPPSVGMTNHSNSVASNNKRSEFSNTKRSVVSNGEAFKHEVKTILKASLLSILVFGLFAYPSEILPIKIVAIICLGLLANYFALNTSNIESESNTSVASTKHREVPRIGIKREASSAQRSGASNGAAKPGTWNLKPVISIAILLITIFVYPQISALKSAHTTWKDAIDLYNYGLYEQCLAEYEKAYPLLKHNGEFLINYGKALSIAGKNAKAVTILEQAKSFQNNSVLYTALGDSHKALEDYESAEQCYSQAANMAPGKFYPLYLLAKLYDASGQQHKAKAMANTILNKEVKLHSVAIEEIRVEMQQILDKYAVEQAHKKDNSGINHRQKGRDNHTNSRKTMLVTLPVAQSINHAPTTGGAAKQKGG